MDEIDKRIFKFIDFIKESKIVSSDNEFASEVGMTRQKLSGIRNRPDRHFTVQDIHKICFKFDVSPSFFFGFIEKKSKV
ncbi:hypothetical protein [Flavobacterium sp.]|jgi:DNA-binding Xre family transcriptional regulator|uniref:hypothetical protein n=1 Tax=Flavobacterium sp. TaxID=239 RepID=UPI0022C54C40|nr:hypothetical protein [Flavobacterium sp.]MCZ8144900.1 hypothetical protein [Flavobacterium sp.]